MPPTGYSPTLWPNFFCSKRGKVLASLDYKAWGRGNLDRQRKQAIGQFRSFLPLAV